MSNNKLKALEAKLTEQQKKAAYMLVENDLKSNKDPLKLTYEQIADEIGVSYKTIWSWRTQNRNFIAYKNEISDDFLSDKRSRVYGQLLKLIEGEQPSVKAIDLFMRRFGLLTEKQIITTEDTSGSNTNEDIENEIAELDELLKDE
jgi:DNA-binding XRE family transcriptional regulator